jgi:hypothetical protein
MAKAQRQDAGEGKVNTAKWLSGKDLCALALLFVHPLVFNARGSKGKEESLFIKWVSLLSLPRKSSVVSACSEVDNFSSPD